MKHPLAFGQNDPKRNKQHITIIIFLLIYYLGINTAYLSKRHCYAEPLNLNVNLLTRVQEFRESNTFALCCVRKCRTTTPHLRADGVTE